MVDQSHLTALMSVLQTAGYELQTDDDENGTHQIILNSVDDAIIVDNQVSTLALYNFSLCNPIFSDFTPHNRVPSLFSWN